MIWDTPHHLFTFLGLRFGTSEKILENTILQPKVEELGTRN
jgi:hypothetical protein